MKKSIKKIFAFVVILAIFASCKKDENQVVFEGGTTPTLTADRTGTISITKPTKSQTGVVLTWTNPNYKLSTGISSQDVNYSVEARVKNIGTYKSISVVKSAVTISLSQEEINTFVTKSKIEGGLDMVPDAVGDIEVRITAFLGANSSTNATNVSSKAITFTLNKPYSTDPDLWITGEACTSNWTNTPPTPQKFTYDRPTRTFSINVSLGAAKYYKFLTVSGQWQPQWGIAAGTSTPLNTAFTIVENPGGGSDPEAIQAPATGGTYKIVVDLINKKATVTP
jgi:starch-binding outer membrane protein SusE/F